MKCLLCNKKIDKTRKKYCSTKCSCRATYLRNNPNKKSYYAKNPDFWKTETGKGFRWEKYSAKILGAKHLKFNGKGADLDWNGKSIDVKSFNLYKRKNKRGKPVVKEQAGVWGFHRGKIKPIDYFFCICLIKNKPVKIYLIPGNVFPPSGACIGHKSKYDKYLFTTYDLLCH